MHAEFLTPDRIRQQYSLKIASALGLVVAVTLAFGVLFGIHITTGSSTGLENRAIAALTGILVIFSINLGLVGIILGGNIALALRQLGSKAEEIGNGNFDIDLTTSRVDEVGSLYDTVGGMRDSLETTLEEVEAEQQRAQEAKQNAEEKASELETERAQIKELQQEAEHQRQQLTTEAEQFSQTMAACANGQLNKRLESTTDNEAMEEIARSFNEMLDGICDVVPIFSSFQ
ncbi:HAMP domain-containing protein [Natrialba sp. SSL1]|uniref:HAMP domain-containing protein n=1 Tax=Natrialba sp. SSL1 TaxID=1869245 RepID=UPI0008F87637|nr:HAMP domain-containing protein [Natrialba sp. SSL1]OIB56210.1 hypothetical protein BBD46_19610 [Natrialba sp. SSL1]